LTNANFVCYAEAFAKLNEMNCICMWLNLADLTTMSAITTLKQCLIV